MTIRIRLTLYYFIITLFILLVFSLWIFQSMRRDLFNTLDQELTIVINSIEASYEPFSHAFMELEFIPRELHPFLEFYLLVYDDYGQLVFESPLAAAIKLDIHLSRDVFEERKIREVLIPRRLQMPPAEPGRKAALRIISRQLHFNNTLIGWAVIGLPIERTQESIRSLLTVLGFSLIVFSLLIGAGGYFLTHKALDPVQMITTKANQISRDNLNERLPIKNEHDELGRLTKTLNNLLQRLQDVFDSQQQFLADAAHELKTPLAVLRMHWENEINNPQLSLTVKEKLVQDIETISRLTHLINSLLLISRTEIDHGNFDKAPVHMDELLRDIISDMQYLANEKSQQINIVQLPAIVCLGDFTRFYQLFFNLIDNAIKYTPEGGQIWVASRRDGDWCVFEIRDNGAGIEAKHVPHIFERFYRVQKDRARKTGGSGLGLTICELIVRSHGGRIEMESEQGAGSTFRVFLPAQSP